MELFREHCSLYGAASSELLHSGVNDPRPLSNVPTVFIKRGKFEYRGRQAQREDEVERHREK